jgi:hypothetical protein
VRSFKFKLVAYFALLSLLPLTAAFIGFSTVAARAETRTVDARLQAELRAALAAYEQELRMEGAAAAALARNPVFERALAARDRAKLERLLRSHPDLTFVGQNGLRIGERVPLAATRQVEVVGPAGARGAVIASIPLDRSWPFSSGARASARATTSSCWNRD